MYYKQHCYRCNNVFEIDNNKDYIELNDYLCPSCNNVMDEVDITKVEVEIHKLEDN